MLSDKNLATLANKLQVPAAFTDILDGRDTLTGDMQYSLHDVISDLQPDSALLAIAISAAKIARMYGEASPGMKVMSLECERIIDDYGTMWLENARNKKINEDEIFDVLVHTAEDLESIAELLDLCTAFLRTKDEQTAALCEILYIQAKAHAMIAEEFISVAEGNQGYNPPVHMSVMKDNVIPFPQGTRRA